MVSDLDKQALHSAIAEWCDLFVHVIVPYCQHTTYALGLYAGADWIVIISTFHVEVETW